jgi:hypothetical protein
MTPLEESGWYDSIALDPHLVIGQGIELQQGRFSLGWNARPVILAQADPQELGGFVSVSRAVLNEPMVVLCEPRLQQFLEAFFAHHASAGWRRAPGSRGLPAGWVAYLDVSIASRAPWTPPELQCLVPAERISISLQGGLKFDASTWLAGAEPTVRAALSEPGTIRIDLDGVRRVEADGSVELDLATLGVQPGEHIIAANGRLRSFQTVRSGDYVGRQLPGEEPQALAHVLRRNGASFEASYPSPQQFASYTPSADEVVIFGSVITGSVDDAPETLSEPICLPGGSRRYILLGARPGMVFECRDPAAPPFAFLRKWQTERAAEFEIAPPFQPVWLVRVSWGRKARVRPAGPLAPPRLEPWPGGDIDAWRRWIRKKYRKPLTPDAAGVWRDYQRAAELI